MFDCWWATAATTGCVVFVRAFILPAPLSMYLPTCLFSLLFCLQPMKTMGRSLSHTHTQISQWNAFRRISLLSRHITPDRQSPPQFIKLSFMELINQESGRVQTDLRQLELLFFFISVCQNSVGISSNDLLFWCFVFPEWGEVSVGGKRLPAHFHPVFSPLFNFLCAVAGLVGTWGRFHSCV